MKAQRGVALITAILVVALAAIAAAAVLSSAMMAVHRAANMQDSEKAWWYADGVESWLKSVLQRDAQDNKTDSLKDDWAKPVDYLPVDEGYVRGAVIDLQGRFNLNNLGVADPNLYAKYVDQFERLVQNIEGADAMQARPLAAAIRDWIDPDQTPTGMDGAEDSEYLSMDPPYRAANRYLESVSELRAIKGMDAKLYGLLRNYVAALPQIGTPVNINTAPEPVLRSLVKQTNPDLEKFLATREEQPADSTAALQTMIGPETPMGLAGISVKSNYFMSRVETFIGSGRLALYSFYYRPDQGAPVVLGRSTDTE
ncbi:MAG TPA: type II secretion system minor pseudopilin GspK [Nevskiaceae bacterium]|nr:type II secretion system minor pseudopilin GspK [Nevskiaceae bacterium]